MDRRALAVFENKEIRKTWHKDEWWFMITDVVAALTDSKDPTGYIKDMRRRDEGIAKGWVQIATPLSITTRGGIQQLNCANTEGLFRIIQSIPSKKAEPFKLWLAIQGNIVPQPLETERIRQDLESFRELRRKAPKYSEAHIARVIKEVRAKRRAEDRN